MPYVKDIYRIDMETEIARLSSFIKSQPDDKRDGLLNYAVSDLVGRTMKPETGWRYHYLHRAYGVFAAAGAEFYRHVVGPYEDAAILENGDVDAYRNQD